MGSKSSSNWLTRLHLAKHLAAPDSHLPLDHFLSNPNPPSPETPSPAAGNPTTATSGRRKPLPSAASPAAAHLTSALADLFVMSQPPPRTLTLTLDRKRPARKQPHPKPCPAAGAGAVSGAGAAASPCSGDNSVVAAEGGKRARTKGRKKRDSGVVDLSAFSRTEVTVIDSSLPGWKAEKIIFRKGLVWKVRDRKVWNLGRKKRKLGSVEKLGGEKEKDGAGKEMETVAGKLAEVWTIKGCSAEKRDASEGTVERIQISARRKKFSRTPRLPVAKDSSVFHLKVIPPNRKNGAPGPKGTFKR